MTAESGSGALDPATRGRAPASVPAPRPPLVGTEPGHLVIDLTHPRTLHVDSPPSLLGLPLEASLEMTPEAMQSAVSLAMQHITDHQERLEGSPVLGDVSGEGLRKLLPELPSRDGESLERLLDDVFKELVPRSYNTASPGHFGWIPAGGVFPAALADLITGAVNRYTGMWSSAPALLQLEADVLRWFCDWFNFPPEARGLFTTGGSMATFGAVVCAREALLGEDAARGVVYTSTQSHHSVAKAARLAGIPARLVRRIPVDKKFRLRPAALRAAVTADRAAGLLPFLVVGTAGTTATGAVDSFHELADITESEGLWLHADAAYGGFFTLCSELRPVLAGLDRVDSLTADPHKSLFLPYGTGALLVRDGELLRQAHADSDSYLPPTPDGVVSYDPSQYGPSLSRDFPGLRVWLTVQMYGIDRITEALREKYLLAQAAAAALESVPGLRIAAPPELSLFAFHVALPGGSLAAENAATERLVREVCARGRSLITGCRIDGRSYARVCVLSFRSHGDHVARLVDEITAVTSALLSGQAVPDNVLVLPNSTAVTHAVDSAVTSKA